jgi:dUTP pyrophosphatase
MFSIVKLHPDAAVPCRASPGDAGYDLCSVEHVSLAAGQRKLVRTGLALQIPSDCYARVAPRSGLAFKKGIDVMAGVVDSSYRGEVGVLLINLSNTDVDFQKGERVAQLIFEKIYTPDAIEVRDTLETSERGGGGFGSTGQ